MKNSFFLVIPAQQNNAELVATYEKEAVIQWVSELPAANPSLATRLLYDFILSFNTVELEAQHRLDVLEIIRPHFIEIEDYLRSRLIRAGFPKGDNEQKIFGLLVSIEKHFHIGYWMVVRELTRRDVGWFKGKNAIQAVQRTLRGLSEIVVTHYMMFSAVPDWIWIDLHSLYKLSVTLKKEASKVVDVTNKASKTTTVEICYKQVLLLSLADPSGLMQKEVRLLYDFIGKICHLIQIQKKPVNNQEKQCLVLMDEDSSPYFEEAGKETDSSMMYLDITKVYKVLNQTDKFGSKDEARFSSMQIITDSTDRLPVDLFMYIFQCWKGIELKGTTLFADRLDRHLVIGLDATFALQARTSGNTEISKEILAESYSERELSCAFKKEGVLSIGSLVSFRQSNEPENRRSLAIVKKLTISKQDGLIIFELIALTPKSYAVTYLNPDANTDTEHRKALIYGVKKDGSEKSFIIMESFMHQNEDVLRMFMNKDNFPIILGCRKNIGLGYWQFECRRIEEKQAELQVKKKGYDFI